jgi:hypothetical protein
MCNHQQGQDSEGDVWAGQEGSQAAQRQKQDFTEEKKDVLGPLSVKEK